MSATQRVVIALGGNAMTGPDGSATPGAQLDAIARRGGPRRRLVAAGAEVVLTHGNGPQVGNLLVKNELAAHVVPPVPLDWNGAQTQATIGFTIADALDDALPRAACRSAPPALVTRTLVDRDDPRFAEPTKPIGRYLPREEAQRFIDLGQIWEDRGEKGWRRVVASPEPLEVLDAGRSACSSPPASSSSRRRRRHPRGARRPDGRGLRGVEAVIDKDLTAALLARTLAADVLVIATDVATWRSTAARRTQRPLGRVTLAELRRARRGRPVRAGSMGPKVEAALRFVAGGGPRAVITSLDAHRRRRRGRRRHRHRPPRQEGTPCPTHRGPQGPAAQRQ